MDLHILSVLVGIAIGVFVPSVGIFIKYFIGRAKSAIE